jgi:hypothetical protein
MDMDSESEVLGYGISLILLNVGILASVIVRCVRNSRQKIRLSKIHLCRSESYWIRYSCKFCFWFKLVQVHNALGNIVRVVDFALFLLKIGAGKKTNFLQIINHSSDIIKRWRNFQLIQTQVEWDARLNILNTDIDQAGNPTNIYYSVNLDMLRQSVCDFKPKVVNFQIPK